MPESQSRSDRSSPASRRRVSTPALFLLAAPLVGVQLALLLVYDLAARLELTLGLLAAGFVALAAAALSLEVRAVPWVPLLAVAALLRILLLPLPPTLSDDLLRYVWDGRVAQAGANPYMIAPDDPTLVPLRDELWEGLPHRQVPTVYPPLAVGVFRLAAALPGSLWVLKAILAAADFLACVLLLFLARRIAVPEGRVVWYAWSPLVTLEGAGMGHVDTLAVAAVVAVVLVIAGRRDLWVAVPAAVAGILAKLVPVVALPMWGRQLGRPGVFVTATLVLVGIAWAPVLVEVGGVPPGLVTYAVSWEFNGPLYEPLWRLLDRFRVAEGAAATLDRARTVLGYPEPLEALYRYLYPQLLAKLVLAGLLVGVVVGSLGKRHGAAGSGFVFSGLLLCSATVYPWYLLWVLPWAALLRHRAWLVLSASVLLCYLPQFRELELFPWVFLAIWLPFWILLWRRPGWSTA